MLKTFELMLTLLQLAPIVVLSIRSRPVMNRLAPAAEQWKAESVQARLRARRAATGSAIH